MLRDTIRAATATRKRSNDTEMEVETRCKSALITGVGADGFGSKIGDGSATSFVALRR